MMTMTASQFSGGGCKAAGHPGPVTLHWSPMSPRTGHTLEFLSGQWQEQPRGGEVLLQTANSEVILGLWLRS